MNSTSATFMERNAGKIFAGLSGLILVLGIGEYLSGQQGDPAMVETVIGRTFRDLQQSDPSFANLLDLTAKIIGSLWIGLGSFGMFISANAFKEGQRWSWYAFLTLALVNILILAAFMTTNRIPEGPTPPAFYSAPIMILISIYSLWASRNNFSEDG